MCGALMDIEYREREDCHTCLVPPLFAAKSLQSGSASEKAKSEEFGLFHSLISRIQPALTLLTQQPGLSMPQSYLSRTSDSQHPQYAHSPSLASPAYAMYQRPPMPMHPLAHSSSASPSGVQMEVGSSSTGRMVDPRYEEEESSPGSANHYTPPRDFEGGPSGRGGKRKGAALDGKDDEQGAVAKRKKKAVSCQSCRKRKLKCDRGWPVSIGDL